MSRNMRWMRSSAVSSGWKLDTRIGPDRHSTGTSVRWPSLPAAPCEAEAGLTVASTSTLVAGALHPRGPDEHGVKGFAEAIGVEIGLEAGDLTAERVAPHRDVDRAEVALVLPAVQHLGS